MIASGQKPVNDDCSKLKPIKAVNQCQLVLWKIGLPSVPKASVSMIMMPANAITIRSIDMVCTPLSV